MLPNTLFSQHSHHRDWELTQQWGGGEEQVTRNTARTSQGELQHTGSPVTGSVHAGLDWLQGGTVPNT